ncbi:MAG: hypothetical protein ACPG7F_00150 [Aggregatilineales bacterium]
MQEYQQDSRLWTFCNIQTQHGDHTVFVDEIHYSQYGGYSVATVFNLDWMCWERITLTTTTRTLDNTHFINLQQTVRVGDVIAFFDVEYREVYPAIVQDELEGMLCVKDAAGHIDWIPTEWVVLVKGNIHDVTEITLEGQAA